MPTFNKSRRDDHCYIRSGWPVGTDTQHSTYQLGPRGEVVLEDYLEYKPGRSVSERLFWALYLDGSLFHENTGRNPSVWDLPNHVVGWTHGYLDSARGLKVLEAASKLQPLDFLAVVKLVVSEMKTSSDSIKSNVVEECASRIFISVKYQDARNQGPRF